MKSIRIANGDIVLGVGRGLSFVDGRQKLAQDLRLWIMEPYGTGPTTRTFGSVVHDHIGETNPEEHRARIESEIRRVIELYIAHQRRRLNADRSAGTLSRWRKSEIVTGIQSLSAKVKDTSIVVKVSISTLSGTDLPLDLELDG